MSVYQIYNICMYREITAVTKENEVLKFNDEKDFLFFLQRKSEEVPVIIIHSDNFTENKISEREIRQLCSDCAICSYSSPSAINRLKNYLNGQKKRIKIICFGNFDVFDSNGKRIKFHRRFSKELLAYLIYRNGSSCSIAEINDVVNDCRSFKEEEREFHRISQSYLSMRQDFQALGINILSSEKGKYAVDMSQLEGDYIRYLEEPQSLLHLYKGEFMAQYPWSDKLNTYFEIEFNKLTECTKSVNMRNINV